MPFLNQQFEYLRKMDLKSKKLVKPFGYKPVIENDAGFGIVFVKFWLRSGLRLKLLN